MPLISLPRPIINKLADWIAAEFEPAAVEEGWNYYYKRRVQKLRLTDARLTARVVGTGAYDVNVDLDRLSDSGCNCSAKGRCPHVAALFFAAAATQIARPELLFRRLQLELRGRARTRRSAALKRLPAEDVNREPRPEDRPLQWHRIFEQRFYGYSLSNHYSVERFYETAKETLEPPAADWDPLLRKLYILHLDWFALKKAEAFYRANRDSYLSFYHEQGCYAVVEAAWNRLQELVRSLNRTSVMKRYPAHLRGTAELTAELPLHRAEPVRWLDVYRLLWDSLLADETLVGNERERLNRQLAETNGPPRRRDALLLAAAWFDLAAGRDDDAMARLRAVGEIRASDYFFLLDRLETGEEWSRLLRWLNWLLPAASSAKPSEFNKLCAVWKRAATRSGAETEWVRAMKRLLPRSYPFYADHLLNSGQYRQWIDLHLAYGATPNDLSSAELKEVERHSPELLLPLYTRAAERAILDKTRSSYVTAVRHLRRLRALYIKLEQKARWETYIRVLAAKYARLRAFQEELKKGNLIP